MILIFKNSLECLEIKLVVAVKQRHIQSINKEQRLC